jgi:hypothetical protein
VLLGEALAERASKRKQLEQVAARAAAVARYQEGEQPAEDAGELLGQGRRLIGELQDLARRINRTNSATELDPGFTLTDALALRDGYTAQFKLVTAIADAGAGSRGVGWGRQLRSELQQISAVPVADLRAEADQIAALRRNLEKDGGSSPPVPTGR